MRAEAARALLDGGDRGAARAQLLRLVDTPDVPADARALAEAALIDLLIQDGALGEAATRLAAAGDERLTGEDAQALRLDLARALVARGQLRAADSTLGPDSSVTAAALRGWIALYGGDLAVADSQFRRAGLLVGDRLGLDRLAVDLQRHRGRPEVHALLHEPAGAVASGFGQGKQRTDVAHAELVHLGPALLRARLGAAQVAEVPLERIAEVARDGQHRYGDEGERRERDGERSRGGEAAEEGEGAAPQDRRRRERSPRGPRSA